MKRAVVWWRRPWLHFLLLGTGLYLAQLLWWQPVSVVGPVSAVRAQQLADQWQQLTGVEPDREQRQQLIAAELDREILIAQALAMDLHRQDRVIRQRLQQNMRFLGMADAGGSAESLVEQALVLDLHRQDEVVKRRLVLLMEQYLLATEPMEAATEEDLKARYQASASELIEPARYTFSQVFIRGDNLPRAKLLLQQIQDERLTPTQARALGDVFLPGYHFSSITLARIEREWGADFAAQFGAETVTPPQWFQPIQSIFGWHLIYLQSYQAPMALEYAKARPRLLRQWRADARQQALAKALKKLRQHYEVRQ